MMSIKRRITAIVAASVASLMLLAGCGGGNTQQAESAKGGETVTPDTITAQVAYATRNFSPSLTSSALALSANWHVTEPLYALDYSTYEAYPALAKGEPEKVSDTDYVITLRDGAKFSDGTAVTADDVVSSYKRTTAEGSLYISMLDFIDSVTAVGDNKVEFKLKQAFPMFKERLALIQVVPSSKSDDELQNQPTGSGPWKYVEITDQQVKFEKNDKYNGKYPAPTKNMVWNVNTDDTARVTAMQGNSADIMEMVPAEAFNTLKSSGSELSTVQGFNTAFLMFNTKKAPFDNTKVRQAVLNAIDIKSLVDNQMAGQAEAATSFLPKNNKYYHKAANVYSYDVKKAKSLLASAGVSEGTTFTLYTTDHSWITKLAPQIKNNLEEIGFKVDIQSMASSALYPNITDTDNADYSIVLAPGDPSVFGNDPDLLMNWWYGDNTWTKKRTFWNGSEGYNKLHELMDKALAASSESDRQNYWNECYDLLSEEVPLYPLLHRKTTTAVKQNAFSSWSAIGTTGLNLVKAKL
ncbi:MAG: ABC transporter substrate-binding protein [Bifidobacteriaceae bacterium]|nr:ABC transporter substrate-binding protein [Bifidobacteriaceae bacterium]